MNRQAVDSIAAALWAIASILVIGLMSKDTVGATLLVIPCSAMVGMHLSRISFKKFWRRDET